MIRHDAIKNDPGEIAKAVNLLFSAGSVIELRCLNGKRATGGYFDDHAALVKAASGITIGNVYVTINEVDPVLLARRANRTDYADATTADENILRRRWLLVDVDCQRPAKISATDEEHEAALNTARSIGKALVLLGWPKPVLADSGNGAHLLFRVELPNDGASEKLVRRVLAQLGVDHDDDNECSPRVKVDQTVSNAGRICKLYGTVARKGDPTADRPHRLSKLIYVPDVIDVVTCEQLEQFAGPEPPAPEPKRHKLNGHVASFDLQTFIAENLKVRNEGPYTNNNGAIHRWKLETCPLCGESDKSAVVLQFGDGRIGYRCHHNRCVGKGWSDLREHLEPGHSERKERNQPPGMDDLRPRREKSQAKPCAEVIPHRAMPTDALPPAVRDYVRAASTAIGCDPCFIALPLLACLARAVGNKRTIQLKRTWKEPTVIWAAIVGKSGTQKTPALQAAVHFLERRQAAAIAKYEVALATWEQDQAIYDRDYSVWKRNKKTDEPPPWPPEEPVCERFITTDITVEALAERLAAQFDGLLVLRDELAGWLGGIAEYKGGKGSDLGHWLASWSAAPLTVDRKTGAKKFLHVPRAAVSIVGGIQPGVLQRAIGYEHLQDGLCARLLLAMPESRPIRWTEATVDPATEQALGDVFDRLLALEPGGDEEGHPAPFALTMTPEAKRLWVAYYDRHRQEQADLDDDLAAAWSKLEAYTARFALIFQLVEADAAIDEKAMRAAIEFSEWFGHEARRVYGLFAESEEDRDIRELVAWIKRKGGSVTVPEVQRGHRRFANADEAESALTALVDAEIGKWEIDDHVGGRGRPARRFTLSTPSMSTEIEESPEISNCVDVDTAGGPQTDQDDDSVQVEAGGPDELSSAEYIDL